MRIIRSLVVTAFTMVLAALTIVLTPGAAHAEDIYRYWAYFTVADGDFVAASTGPADAEPEDGAIEAYRYAAPADFDKPNLPRADLSEVTFDSVCGDSEAGSDEKRVAVLIDYGVEQDAAEGKTPPAPQALCAVVPSDANGLQVLEKVAPDLRTESGSFGPMLCGISGYPATGCASDKAEEGTPADGEPVSFEPAGQSDEAAGDKEDDDSNTPLLVGVGVVVVLLGLGGFFLSRRRAAGA